MLQTEADAKQKGKAQLSLAQYTIESIGSSWAWHHCWRDQDLGFCIHYGKPPDTTGSTSLAVPTFLKPEPKDNKLNIYNPESRRCLQISKVNGVPSEEGRTHGYGAKPTSYPRLNIPIPTKIGSMGGEFTYQPTWDQWC